MARAGIFPKKLHSFQRFKVSQLTPDFLLASRRQKALTTYWLVEIGAFGFKYAYGGWR